MRAVDGADGSVFITGNRAVSTESPLLKEIGSMEGGGSLTDTKVTFGIKKQPLKSASSFTFV